MWGLFIILAVGWFELRLLTQRKHIMSVISDFAARVTEQFATINTAAEGVTLDIAALNKKIEQLQNSSGEISAEDQAILNSIENIAAGVAAKLKALDEATAVTPTPDEPTNPTE